MKAEALSARAVELKNRTNKVYDDLMREINTPRVTNTEPKHRSYASSL